MLTNCVGREMEELSSEITLENSSLSLSQAYRDLHSSEYKIL